MKHCTSKPRRSLPSPCGVSPRPGITMIPRMLRSYHPRKTRRKLMAIAKRRSFREWLRDLVHPVLLKPSQSARSPAGAAHPQLPQNAAPGSGNGPLPLSLALSGHAQVTVIPTSAPPAQNLPTVLGSDHETGEAVTVSLQERFQGIFVI